MPKKSKPDDQSKKKVSVSLSPENLSWLEEQVKSMKFRSVSHGLDLAVSEFRKKVEKEKED